MRRNWFRPPPPDNVRKSHVEHLAYICIGTGQPKFKPLYIDGVVLVLVSINEHYLMAHERKQTL